MFTLIVVNSVILNVPEPSLKVPPEIVNKPPQLVKVKLPLVELKVPAAERLKSSLIVISLSPPIKMPSAWTKSPAPIVIV